MEELTNKEKEVKRIKEMQDKEAKKIHTKIVIKYIVGTLVTVIAVIAAFCVSVPTGLFCLLGFPFCFAFGVKTTKQYAIFDLTKNETHQTNY